jgi:Uma2 family endonuclease
MKAPLKTEDDLLNMQDDEMRHELVAGMIVAEPLPSPWHDHVRRSLGRQLEDFVKARRLGTIFWDTGFLLAKNPDTVRGPDLSFVTRDRMAGIDLRRFIPGPPDLAVEILSPTNRAGKVRAKLADYLDAGCRLVWVIHPIKKVATAYRPLEPPRRIAAGSALDGEDVLPGLLVPLASIFVTSE